MENKAHKSHIVFGEWALVDYAFPNATEDDIIWAETAEAENNMSWVISLKNMTNSFNETITEERLLIPDTGEVFLKMPPEDIHSLITSLLKHDIACGLNITSSLYECQSNDISNFPSL